MWQHIGQSLEDVARRDTDWDPNTGKVKRGLFESAGDWIRGYSAEDINKKRQELETTGLRNSRAGKAVARMAGDNPGLLGLEEKLKGYDYQTTQDDVKSDLANAVRLKQAQELAASQNVDIAGLTDAERQNVGILSNLSTKKVAEDARNTPEAIKTRERGDQSWQMLIDDRTNQTEERRLERLDRAEARRDDYNIRLDDLDMRRQQESNKMDIYRQQLSNQRADKKQAQMMALIQGLATLGSGFAL